MQFVYILAAGVCVKLITSAAVDTKCTNNVHVSYIFSYVINLVIEWKLFFMCVVIFFHSVMSAPINNTKVNERDIELIHY